LGYFRVVRIKIKQAFFKFFGGWNIADRGIMVMLVVYLKDVYNYHHYLIYLNGIIIILIIYLKAYV